MGCRKRAPKAQLIRLVRGPHGTVRPDSSGKAPGRGAYVHPRLDCWTPALGRGALARALRTALGQEEAGNLRKELEGALEH